MRQCALQRRFALEKASENIVAKATIHVIMVASATISSEAFLAPPVRLFLLAPGALNHEIFRLWMMRNDGVRTLLRLQVIALREMHADVFLWMQ